MPRNRSLALPVLVLLLVVPGCSMDPTEYSLEEVVIAQAYMVQRVVEAYALEHGGEYPSRLASNFSEPLIDPLLNPYTRMRAIPDWQGAIAPGDVGYRPIWVEAGYGGYVINGVGESSDIIVLSKNYPDSLVALDLAVLANCRLVHHAAEAFAAENGGEYAYDVDDLIEFLPGGGRLVNPFTGADTEPSSGTAATQGQTGYATMADDQTSFGYNITAFGQSATIGTLCGPPEVCWYFR